MAYSTCSQIQRLRLQMLTGKRVSFSAAGIHPSSNGDDFDRWKTGLHVSRERQHCVMNSVGGHVVAKLRPDPRIVHEVERTGRTPSLSRWLLRELALVGVTARPPTRWDQVLLWCPGQISNERRRCYSSPSTPSRHGRKVMCSGVYPPQATG